VRSLNAITGERSREVGRLVGEDWTDMMSFVQRARGADVETVIRPEARQAIKQAVAAGIRLAILSNELGLFYGADFRLPLLDRVRRDRRRNLYEDPEAGPRAYEQVLTQLHLPRENCVFVDDQKKNIDGAIAVGLPHVHFDVMRPAQSYAQALRCSGLRQELICAKRTS
jgi:putative hydrolase of the HAD superfamily